MEDLNKAFEGWGRLVWKEAETMVLAAGFKEVGRETLGDHSERWPEVSCYTKVSYALPDFHSRLDLGFSVQKYPVSISYHVGAVCEKAERVTGDPCTANKNAHRRNYKDSNLQIADFFQEVKKFTARFASKLGLEDGSELAGVYDDLERKGLLFIPAELGKPFVFAAGNGGLAVIRRDEEKGLVLETRWPGVEKPCSSKTITELARYHRNRAPHLSTRMQLSDLVLA